MAKVRLTTAEQQEWTVSGARDAGDLPDGERQKLRQGELTSAFKVRETGDAAHPQLVELRYQPEAEIRTHSHDEDEIIYVLSGAMRVNNRLLGPGACLNIPGGTFYGFRAGPEGLHILNFRPRSDPSFNLPPARG